jgi:hypothetical protein
MVQQKSSRSRDLLRRRIGLVGFNFPVHHFELLSKELPKACSSLPLWSIEEATLALDGKLAIHNFALCQIPPFSSPRVETKFT